MAECPSRQFEMEERERDRAAEKEMVDEGRGVMVDFGNIEWTPDEWKTATAMIEAEDYPAPWNRTVSAVVRLMRENAALRKKLIEEQAVAEERGKAVLENIALRKRVKEQESDLDKLTELHIKEQRKQHKRTAALVAAGDVMCSDGEYSGAWDYEDETPTAWRKAKGDAEA